MKMCPSKWTNISVDVINGCGIDYMHTVLLGLSKVTSYTLVQPKIFIITTLYSNVKFKTHLLSRLFNT